MAFNAVCRVGARAASALVVARRARPPVEIGKVVVGTLVLALVAAFEPVADLADLLVDAKSSALKAERVAFSADYCHLSFQWLDIPDPFVVVPVGTGFVFPETLLDGGFDGDDGFFARVAACVTDSVVGAGAAVNAVRVTRQAGAVF